MCFSYEIKVVCVCVRPGQSGQAVAAMTVSVLLSAVTLAVFIEHTIFILRNFTRNGRKNKTIVVLGMYPVCVPLYLHANLFTCTRTFHVPADVPFIMGQGLWKTSTSFPPICTPTPPSSHPFQLSSA